MPTTLTSGSFPEGLPHMRSEAEIRSIRARRQIIEDSYRAEGFSEAYIAAHVSDELAEKMLQHERQTLDFITNLFGPS